MNKATSILVAYFTLFMVCWVYIYSISEIPFVFAIRVTVTSIFRTVFIWFKYYLSSFGVCLCV